VVWLTALAVVAWLQLPPLPTPDAVGAIPLPTALLLGGVLARLLHLVVTRVAIGIGARRHAAALRRDLHDRLGAVLDDQLLAPVADEVERTRRLHRAVGDLAVTTSEPRRRDPRA
jgi:hypothetical protein